MEQSNYNLILQKLEDKASLKQQIYRNTMDVFALTKKAMSKLASKLHQDYTVKNPTVEITYKDAHQFEAELKFSGDLLMLSMHSNVFNFEEGHRIYSSSYVKSDPTLSYCGVIYIHNFLADSIKYNRLSDEGTLVARILINKEKRFIIEGEGQLGFIYDSFSEEEISEEALTCVLEMAILECINTDLQLPSYDNIKDITLYQKQTILAASGYPTGKRLGYLFKSEMQSSPI